MTMLPVRRIFVTLFLATTFFLGSSYAQQDTIDQISTACLDQALALFSCLSAQGVNLTAPEDAFGGCEACINAKNTIGEEETVKCSEVEGLVNDALADCSTECMLDGCPKELNDVVSCGLTGNVECEESAAAPRVLLGVAVTILLSMMMIFVA